MHFEKISLRKGQKNVALFVDTGPESNESISTSQKNTKGYCNEPLAMLFLNQSGVWNDVLRYLGLIPVLYVTKSSRWRK